MNQERRAAILTIFCKVSIVTTEQVATLFSNAQPAKRASAALHQLEEEKLIEGKRRAMGESKIWRLSSKGRKLLKEDIATRAVPLTTANLAHYLLIADAYLHMSQKGRLLRWECEPRYPFGGKDKYCPDAFFWWKVDGKNVLGFLEAQVSDRSSVRWGYKWAMASTFYDSEYFPRAAFQTIKARDGSPVILKKDDIKIFVISRQMESTIRTGTKLGNIKIFRAVKEIAPA